MTREILIADLQPIRGEPRIRDIKIGEALGFDRANSVRVLIKRNMAELLDYGTVHQIDALVRRPQGGTVAGCEFWLNEPQTILLCMFSNTPAAAAVRKQVIDVFMAWRQGKTVDVARHFRKPRSAPVENVAFTLTAHDTRRATIVIECSFRRAVELAQELCG